jgi:hypothetical protein
MMLSYLLVFVVLMITTGVILGVFAFCQCVHYPLYKKIKEGFSGYEQEFQRMMMYFVTPLIIIDVFTNVILAVRYGAQAFGILLALTLMFNIMTWLVTFFFQVEYHKKLLLGFSSKNMSSMIKANWVAMLLWVAKVGCLCAYVVLVHTQMR